jgi:RNA recognition motif-containing protein
MDSRGSSKGVGSVKLNSKQEAQYAVTALNGKSHMNKTLTVRLDTESTVVGVLPPMVVDGTSKSGVSTTTLDGLKLMC